MEARIRIRGSAEEISEALRALSLTTALRTTAVELADEEPPSTTSSDPAESEKAFVTTRFARRVLRRRRLSTPMRKVLQALYEAHPEWLSLPTLHGVSGYRPPQFAGLMGAFGRRMANTKGYDPEAHFFEYRWNDAERTWDYRLPESVREALELEQLV